MTHNKKVVVGLSGGVDSAVSAFLLKQQGYQVSGVYLSCWEEPGCKADESRRDALRVALQLEIPMQVLDFRDQYKQKVLDHFFAEYKAGRTPNPDILCNSVIKFGLFYDWALEHGFDYVATGHYAKVIRGEDNYQLAIPKDVHKDQTYFLYQLKQEQLSHILFPLADLHKSEVRSIARENTIVVADKKDSMGICFVGDISVSKWLKEKFGEKKGEVQLSDRTTIGEHDGYYLFTIGSRGRWRRKLKIDNETIKNDALPKLYVSRIIPDQNVIVVGEREEVMTKEFSLENIHWINPGYRIENATYSMRIRNTGDLIPARLIPEENKMKVILEKPEFGVSSGQSGVIYVQTKETSVCLGGGIITRS